ncbi:MAG TPA: DUF1614 domain-containing protein [Xanthobacteraceae bacterium]
MQMSQYHYLPMAPGFFAILVGIFLLVLILQSLRYAYVSLGVSPGTALLLLFASLVGSVFNIPVAEFAPEPVVSDRIIDYFGMQYEIPTVTHWQGTVIAVNVGGAVIPTLLSLYLLVTHHLWIKGAIATTVVAVVLHWVANPVPGLGIAVPVFLPVVVTAAVALILSRQEAAPLAYIGGGLGTLIGADLTNLDKVSGLGAPVASIGGAGTFDGIFLTGILAVLIANLYPHRRPEQSNAI